MLDERRLWTRIRARAGEDIKTLTTASLNRVGRVRDDDLDVHSVSRDTPPKVGSPRRITRKELYSIYKAAHGNEPVAVKDIGEGGRLEHLRETLYGRSGSAMLGLLLHTVGDELEKVRADRSMGLRTKESR